MKTNKKALFILLFACGVFTLNAQENVKAQKYRRSSLYTILINHDDQNYASEIQQAFLATPIPEKFNDHDLSVKIIKVILNSATL